MKQLKLGYFAKIKLLPESQYVEIPNKIRAAYTAKLEANNAKNHRFGQISLAIASGKR